MKRRSRVVRVLGMLALAAASAMPALASPFIEYTMNPTLPDYVVNPGGLFTGWCLVHPDQTTPARLVVRVVSPDGELLSSYESVDSWEYTQFFVVEEGMDDGVYRYQVEYWSTTGLESFIDAGFLVAGLVQQGICAIKFNDLNANGLREASEPFMGGFEFCATPGVGCKFSTDDGLACWRGMAIGTYTLCETPQTGWENTTPICQTFLVESGPIVKVMFGNHFVGTPVEETSWGRIKLQYR